MLPVEAIVPELLDQIKHRDVVLSAPPGAGKSTFLPLKLLQEPCFGNHKIIMLQPRRVAVRAIAEFLASQLGEQVGETIGYRVRGEQKVSRATRMEIVTEGLLTRMLQSDPELRGVGLVIFDEFHERNLHADFSLALCLDVKQNLRDDLRLLVMSATLDSDALQQLLPDATYLHSEGKSFPVELHYHPLGTNERLGTAVARLVRQVVADYDGNMLVFLPGRSDILDVERQLDGGLGSDVTVATLYGSLGKQQQQQALAPTKGNQRKVVLATNIAETSLTIEGITLVIDSGLEKVSRFNLSRGIEQLVTQRISQASSIQRAGRAGRLSPGHCFRLWAEDSQSRLSKHITPQICQSDVTPWVLEAKSWGSDLATLDLLDKPSEAQLSYADTLLQEMEAIDGKCKLTSHGKDMAALGSHPRTANMLLHAEVLGPGAQALACLMTALLESSEGIPTHVLPGASDAVRWLLRNTGHRAWQPARQWARRLSVQLDNDVIIRQLHLVPVLIGLANPDHLAKSRGNGRYQMVNGGGARTFNENDLPGAEYLAIGSLMLTKDADAVIQLAEPVNFKDIEQHFSHMLDTRDLSEWDDGAQRIQSRRQTLLGKIQIKSVPAGKPSAETVRQMWLDIIRREGLVWLDWPEAVLSWLNRARLANRLYPGDIADFSEATLLDDLEQWLGPFVGDKFQRKALQSLDWFALLSGRLSWPQQQWLDREFPPKFQVPTGSKYSLLYDEDGTVVLSVRMQEMYGLGETPTVAGGKLPVMVELLSPAGRPIQKTSDLSGFWQGSYKEVQKEMKGRYPKHFWPDDPAQATATRHTKKRMQSQN